MAAYSVTSLQKIAENKIVESLGERAKNVASIFCCGNTLSSPERVRLACGNSGENWSSVTFPDAEQAAVQQLLDACCLAPVTKKPRTGATADAALILDTDQFLTSFELYHTPILDEIQKLMLPDAPVGSVRAELCGLSVYGPGSKARKDSLTASSEVCGRLIVCLPTQLTGGALVVRHLEREIRFDWSSSPQNPMQKVSWAAFLSNARYEVLPVTHGYHLSLSYDLYTVVKEQGLTSAPIITSPLTASPFYLELRAAVSNPHFLREGGVLGFCCQNQYIPQDLNQTGDLPHLLRGADSIVYGAAKSLDLPVIVKPVTTVRDIYHSIYGRTYKTMRLVLPTFSHDSCDGCKPSKILHDKPFKIFEVFDRVHNDRHIMWCQDLTNLRPAAYKPRPKRRSKARVIGDKPCFIVCQVACILVGVPRWGK